MPYREARVMVFGASGFIGRWVARALCRLGARPYLPVRESAEAKQTFLRYCITGEIINADLRQLESVENTVRRIAPDVIFNLAGYGIDRSERDEASAYQINAHLVKVICEALARSRKSSWRGQRMIHAGSALEYGKAGGNLAETSPVHPTTLYGKSKLLGTHFLSQCCREQGIKGLTARLFTVYGPGEHPGRLLPALLDAAKTGTSLPLTSGLQKRDFTYVEEVAEGLLRLGLCTVKGGDVVNLATGQLTTVRGFAKTAAELLGIPDHRLLFGSVPVREEEMRHDEVAVARLRDLTGWMPQTTIREGIGRTRNFEQGDGKTISNSAINQE